MRRQDSTAFWAIVAGMLISLGACGKALAQSADPPDRVAQLSYLDGSVAVEPAGTGTWTSAVLNRPLTIGDKLWADRDSRAELDIGDAVIRLGSMTGVSFLNLDDQTAQMQVSAGTVIVHVRTLAGEEHEEIDTPNLALTLEQPGTYRVEVSESGDTTIVKVYDGGALATGGGQSYPVAAQQSVTFTGTNTLAADYAMLGAPDPLDEWSMRRDQEAQQQAAVVQQYVAPDMTGADDLGSYGTWQDTPDWGYAWFPAVAAGWAPYSLGSWLWVSPWGWTWVDAEPWGFAPFHYGRWGYWKHHWCWVPGPRVRVRPTYAPALVGWVGGRRGAHVGWFPLGPKDVYVPGYRASLAYVRNANITNTRIVNTTEISDAYEGRGNNARYGNSRVPGAVTAVPRNIFTSARPVGPHRLHLPLQRGVSLRATTAAPAIIPARQSVLGMNAGRVLRPPPRALIDRPVVARLAPPRAPVSFAREQAAIRSNGGRPLSMTELSRLQPNMPVAHVRLASPGMAMRPQSRAPRNDRPAWAQARPMQPFAPMRARPQPGQPALRQVAPERQMPQQRFDRRERPLPEQRFTPKERPAPEERFTPPPRPAPERRFNPPPRQSPEERFAPPPRQVPEERFTPPERAILQQRFLPPPREQSAPVPREAPARPPAPRPDRHPP